MHTNRWAIPLKVSREVKDHGGAGYQLKFKQHWYADGGNGGFYPGKVYYEYNVVVHKNGLPISEIARCKNSKWKEERDLVDIISKPCMAWYADHYGRYLYCPLTYLLSIKKVNMIYKVETITTTGTEILQTIL